MSDFAVHREAMRIVEDRLRNPQPVSTPAPKQAAKKKKKKKPYKAEDNG